MAAYLRLIHRRSLGLWDLFRHLCVSVDCAADGTAGAALQKPQCSEQRSLSAYTRQRIQSLLRDNLRHLCSGPEFSSWIRTGLAAFGTERSARGSAIDRNLSRRQRNSRSAGVSPGHLSHRRIKPMSHLPGWLHLSHIERRFHPRIGTDPVTSKTAPRLCRIPAIHLRQVAGR